MSRIGGVHLRRSRRAVASDGVELSGNRLTKANFDILQRSDNDKMFLEVEIY